MMKTKKFFASILAAAMTISSVPVVTNFVPTTISTTAYAVTGESSDRYFYNQLSGQTAEETKAYQNFYNAMEQMLTQGLFEEGKDLDLVKAGYFTSEQVSAYAGGEGNVLNIYGAARDAFTGDHPEVFYVDFSALSIRIKKDSNNQYHLYLGSGRRENYWTESFKSADEVKQAISKYNDAFNEAYNSLSGEGKDFITAAHDYITKNTSYRLENKFAQDDTAQYLIRTSYGSLVNHKAVCEGYARLFKAFMDKKGIPCVLIQGAYRPDAESYELHMWTYVEIDGAWYAVDPTIDDPTNSKKGRDEVGEDGYENHEYLLKGESKMAVKYAPSGIRSESNYEFKYPELNYDNYGNEVVYNSNGLMVSYEPAEMEGEKAGKFIVSYKGMGLQAAKAAGYNMMYDCLIEKGGVVTKSASWNKNEEGYDKKVAEAPIGDMIWTGMTYMSVAQQAVAEYPDDSTAEASDNAHFYTTPEHLVLVMPQAAYVKFAVTRVPQTSYRKGDYLFEESEFTGDKSDYVAESDAIYNPNGFYKAPPYPKEVSPSLQSALLIDDGTREISATFDQNLYIDEEYLAKNDGRISLRMNLQDMYEIKNTSGYDNSTIENFRVIFDDNSVSEPISADVRLIAKGEGHDEVIETVDPDRIRYIDGSDPSTLVGKTIIGYKFDFTPSIMYADDNIFYEFDVKGLKAGKLTVPYHEMDSKTGEYLEETKYATVDGKEPIAISFLAAHRCAAHAFQSQGYDWNVFGKPTLMDDLKGTDFSKWSAVGDSSDIVNDGNTLSDALSQLTHRMVLVATDANKEQKENMNDLLETEDGLGELAGGAAEFDNAEYYNINLTLCKSQIVSTGQAVRVTLGFPAGYGPEDKGKTFKVYHFSKNEKGEITGVNEIPCEITEYGLVVWCDAFSPFAVIPVDIAEAKEALAGDATKLAEFENSIEHKSVIFTTKTIGGTIKSNDVEEDMPGTIIVDENETATIDITAIDGYDIESIKVGEKVYEVTDENKDEAHITVSLADYNEIQDDNAIVDVQFVAESVVEKESKANEGETVEPHETATKFKDGFSAVVGHNISLGGNIGLNFYVEFKDVADTKDATATITLPNGKTVEQKITDAQKYPGMTNTYKFSCEVSAKDITKDAKLVIKLADGRTSTENSRSVEQYLKTILNEKKLYAKEQNLATSLMTYGEVANAYFANTATPETEAMKAVTAETLAKYQAVKKGVDTLPEGVKYRSTSLVLESETTLRHYFDVTDEAVAQELGLTKRTPELYYYDFAHINAHMLGVAKEFKKGNFSISASPLSYAYAVLASPEADNGIKNLVKALYLYNVEADKY